MLLSGRKTFCFITKQKNLTPARNPSAHLPGFPPPGRPSSAHLTTRGRQPKVAEVENPSKVEVARHGGGDGGGGSGGGACDGGGDPTRPLSRSLGSNCVTQTPALSPPWILSTLTRNICIDFTWCRGAEVQRCRGAEVQRCRGADAAQLLNVHFGLEVTLFQVTLAWLNAIVHKSSIFYRFSSLLSFFIFIFSSNKIQNVGRLHFYLEGRLHSDRQVFCPHAEIEVKKYN